MDKFLGRYGLKRTFAVVQSVQDDSIRYILLDLLTIFTQVFFEDIVK